MNRKAGEHADADGQASREKPRERKCPTCGTPNRSAAHFCKRCAHLLVEFCPRCHVKLPADADFCDNCALPLTPAATQWPPPYDRQISLRSDAPHGDLPSASTVSQPGSASAPGSGSVVVPQRESTLKRLMPRELAVKLETTRSQDLLQGERRVVTILFCDVKGSTAAAEQLDPEDWTEIINGAFEQMIQPVYRYEGMVARLMGDAVLAFFGAPIAHEDDPERAVLAGLNIVAGIAQYREEIRQRWGIDLDVRVGINTGLVVVGEMGSDLHMEYTALGDATNVAARMEETAAPGSVQIAGATHRMISSLFEFEELGGIEVKGKSEAVPAYRVLGRRADPGRTRGIEGFKAELVGRSEEMERLEVAVDNLRHAIGGIVCLMGAAGMGKSRMIQELKMRLQEDGSMRLLEPQVQAPGANGGTTPVEWIEFACLSYESNHSYALIQHLFRRLNGIAPTVAEDGFWEKVTPLVERFPPERRERILQTVATLYGLPDPSGQLPLEGEHFQRELSEVFHDIWRVHFEERSAVLVLDDLHWADPASVELLLRLLPTVDVNPVVWLCSFRPDRDAPCYAVKQLADAELHHRYTEINVRPLTAQQSDDLVNRLLPSGDLPRSLRVRIEERSGGNPFFVEEVVRSLIESGALVTDGRPTNGETDAHWRASADDAEIEIPDNLQGLLSARIDRLPTEAKRILQMAAVIGRSFDYRVLAEIAQRHDLASSSVETQLGLLVRREILQEAARVPELEYRFRNPLTQEIAYRTVLNRQRRELHAQVGEAMEVIFSEHEAEIAPRLAFHFAEAMQASKAARYYTLAGDNAFRRFGNEEAASHYAHALAWAERTERTNRQLIHLYRSRGRALELIMNHGEAFALYQELEALGRAREEDELRLAGILAQATIYYTGLSDLENARLRSEEALCLARELGDPVAETRSLWNLLLCLSFRDPPQALQYGMDGLQIARKLVSGIEGITQNNATQSSQDAGEALAHLQDANALELLDLLAFFLVDLTFPLIADGQLDAALASAKEARERFEQVGNPAMVATSHNREAMVHWHLGDLDEAIAANDRGVDINLQLGNEGGVASLSSVKLILSVIRGEFDLFFKIWDQVRSIWQRESGFRAVVSESFGIAAYAPLGAHKLIGATLPGSIPEQDSLALDFTIYVLSVAAKAYIRAGELEAARKLLQQCGPNVRKNNLLSFAEPSFVGAEAELALALGQAKESLTIADTFLQSRRPAGMLGHMPAVLLIKGKALHKLGEFDETLTTLREACALAREQSARIVLWQGCAELAALEEAQGNHKQAELLRREALDTVEYIAEHAGRADLRATFLARPDVAALRRA